MDFPHDTSSARISSQLYFRNAFGNGSACGLPDKLHIRSGAASRSAAYRAAG